MNAVWLLFIPSLIASAVSLFFTKLSLFALLLAVIALAAWTRYPGPEKKKLWIVLLIGLSASLVGTVRFILGEAMPGIIEARSRASSARAVSFLREILFAEDALRRYAMIDHDKDGVGSAGLLGEMTGAIGARRGRPLETPPLAPRLAPKATTKAGPALLEDGYYFIVCLPTADGRWSGEPSEDFDDEKAERRFLAYAWPAKENEGPRALYVLDERENILEDENRAKNGEYRYVGALGGPPCTDALDAAPSRYHPWRGKKPRAELPGDKK